MHERGEKCLQNLVRNLKVRDNLENIDIGGRIILKWLLKDKV
jgi:hypothetical protein